MDTRVSGSVSCLICIASVFNLAGARVWPACIRTSLGMTVNSDGEVYLQVMGSSETFGDVFYGNMGSSDQYIVKLDKDGHGAFVLVQKEAEVDGDARTGRRERDGQDGRGHVLSKRTTLV